VVFPVVGPQPPRSLLLLIGGVLAWCWRLLAVAVGIS